VPREPGIPRVSGVRASRTSRTNRDNGQGRHSYEGHHGDLAHSVYQQTRPLTSRTEGVTLIILS
jgi:hypothetical protein